MKERLDSGFTLIFGKTCDDRIRGGYLKTIKRRMIPCELCGDEILFVSKFPHILEKITQACILQIYKSSEGYVSMIGNTKYEGPYAEEEYLDILSSSINDNLTIGLNELNENLGNQEKLSHQKIYRMYGSDKYKI